MMEKMLQRMQTLQPRIELNSSAGWGKSLARVRTGYSTQRTDFRKGPPKRWYPVVPGAKFPWQHRLRNGQQIHHFLTFVNPPHHLQLGLPTPFKQPPKKTSRNSSGNWKRGRGFCNSKDSLTATWSATASVQEGSQTFSEPAPILTTPVCLRYREEPVEDHIFRLHVIPCLAGFTTSL